MEKFFPISAISLNVHDVGNLDHPHHVPIGRFGEMRVNPWIGAQLSAGAHPQPSYSSHQEDHGDDKERLDKHLNADDFDNNCAC